MTHPKQNSALAHGARVVLYEHISRMCIYATLCKGFKGVVHGASAQIFSYYSTSEIKILF